MSLSDKAREARAKADASTDPSDHALANALEAALDAEAREQLRELEPEPADPHSFPDPPMSHVRVPRGGVEN
jgi:hypothetical protein